MAETHLSLMRGLKALEFVVLLGPVSLAQVARHLEVRRSTAHHMMQALVRFGYLSQVDKSRHYEVTQKTVHLPL